MCKDIIFTGPVDYKEVPKYLASSDVLVAPFNTKTDRKRREAFRRYGMWWCPIKIFEYMATAKPVVASNVGEVPEYIKAAGLIYKEGDTRELAEKIVTLLQNEELSVMLGKEGKS